MFQIGDKVVHPMYGAGTVDSMVQQTVDGEARDYYILKLPNRSMVVMIPTDNCEPGSEPLLFSRCGGTGCGSHPSFFRYNPLDSTSKFMLSA